MQKEKNIPPTSHQDYDVNICIRICPNTLSRYDLYILTEGQALRSSITMSPNDLKELNAQLQQALLLIMRDNEDGQKPLIEEYESQLLELARIGHYAFNRIFSQQGSLETIRQLTSHNQNICIEIVSEEFFFPWELIYPYALDEELSYKHFWGLNHIISRVIVKEDRLGAYIPTKIYVNSLPKLGLLTYEGLGAVVDKELHFFKTLEKENKVNLYVLRSLNPSEKHKELEEFKDFWNNRFDLAHFACHANYDNDSPQRSYVLLSEDFKITLLDMDAYDMKIDGHPLVFMNACETGNLNPLYTSNFAATFLKYGAMGVVATECSLPDSFAADFAEQLYTHLLSGDSLGKSLLAKRKYFLENYDNPSGIVYSMYAPPSIRLIPIGGCSLFGEMK